MQARRSLTSLRDTAKALLKRALFSFRTFRAVKLAQPAQADIDPCLTHVPVLLRPMRDGHRIYWLPRDELKLTTPFFDQAVQRRLVTPPRPNIRYTRTFGIRTSVPPPSAFIFHISRCGSTLLANVLRADPAHIMLAEPALVHDLIDNPHLIEDRDRQRMLLRGAIDSLIASFRHHNRRYFFKFPSLALLDPSVVLELYPDVPWIFLMRDPLEAAVSNLEKAPRWLNRRNESALIRRLVPAPGRSDVSKEELITQVLGAFFRNASMTGARKPVIVDYTALTRDGIGRVCEQIGVSLANIDTKTLDHCFLYHAKSEGRVRFLADSTRRRAQAPENLVRLIDAQVRPSYAALKNGIDGAAKTGLS